MGCISGETFLACICTCLLLYSCGLERGAMLTKSKKQGLRLSSYYHYVAGSETCTVFRCLKFRYSCAYDVFSPTTYSEINYSSIRYRFTRPDLLLSFWEGGRTLLGLGGPRSQIFISSTLASKCLDHTQV